jgi:hypothetical protein
LLDAEGGLSLTNLAVYAVLILLPFNAIAGSVLAIVAFANYGHRREYTDAYNKERAERNERLLNHSHELIHITPLKARLDAVEAIAQELQTNAAIAGMVGR